MFNAVMSLSGHSGHFLSFKTSYFKIGTRTVTIVFSISLLYSVVL